MSVLTSHIGFFQTKWASEFADSGDTCVVKEQTGSSFNESTGQTEPTYTTRYSGACIARDLSGFEEEFGDYQHDKRRFRVFIPYDSTALEPGFIVDVTSTQDADLTTSMVVKSVGKDTWNVVRILECEEDQSV